jgi:hypothetical protein
VPETVGVHATNTEEVIYFVGERVRGVDAVVARVTRAEVEEMAREEKTVDSRRFDAGVPRRKSDGSGAGIAGAAAASTTIALRRSESVLVWPVGCSLESEVTNVVGTAEQECASRSGRSVILWNCQEPAGCCCLEQVLTCPPTRQRLTLS